MPGTKQELQGILGFLLTEGTREPWQMKESFPSLGEWGIDGPRASKGLI